ncbi:hypothetical protein V2J09_017268 [Rumex salicifolius]
MGVRGHLWEILKPYARFEGFDFLRDKKVAVDLSFWIVQHETAIKDNARNPHLRLIFFRTVNLFSKFGAFPVFIMDGSPSPLKSEARIRRFYRSSGIDISSLPAVEESIPVERNQAFQKSVKECAELLKLLGIPVLIAKGEAEALCAKLNDDGLVDACITADSDAFLYGAYCVIKSVQPGSKEPFECYYMSDIKAALGLKRKHLIAVSLLVGNDYDLNGVQGIGIDTAVRFVKRFSEDEILDSMHIIGSGVSNLSDGSSTPKNEETPTSNKVLQQSKTPHCSFCGHPGNKISHCKSACLNCLSTSGENCSKKPLGFMCECSSCVLNKKVKEQKKDENWHLRVCEKIAMEGNFPKNEIIEMYMGRHNEDHVSTSSLTWGSPQTDSLIEFLVYHQHWSPSFIRQRMLPMLSTIFLREMVENPTTPTLLYGQFEFDTIERVKVRNGHSFYVVKWKKPLCMTVSSRNEEEPIEVVQLDESESNSILDDPDGLQILVENGCSSILTDENMELVQRAFPEKVNQFLKQKGKRKITLESPNSGGRQVSITEYFQTAKLRNQVKAEEDSDLSSLQKQHSEPSGSKPSPPILSKSVRRRLLFD